MILELDGLTCRYGEESAVLDVSFELASGELVGLLGPSGCGKTTVVQAIAGHVRPDEGRIRLRGADVTDDPPESRRVGLVFQEPTLFPHMTVRENVAYGLGPADVLSDRRTELVVEYLDLVDLADEADSYPAALSGGQRRRVELARALAPQPDVLLLDEPLSALDRTLRTQLREEIARVQRETGVTTLFVTHDQDEAMALADRLVVMNESRVAAVGQPRSLYRSPPSQFVANFLGRSTTFAGTVRETDPLSISTAGREITLPGLEGRFESGETVTCHLRPRDLSLRESDPDTDHDGSLVTLEGIVSQVVDLGRHYEFTVRCADDTRLRIEHTGSPPSTDSSVAVAFSSEDLTVFSSRGADRNDP